MANIELIKTDVDKETNGVWVDFALGIRLKIARARNPKYTEFLRNLVEPKRQDIRDDKMDIEDFSDLLLKVRAKTILLDWENLEDEIGNQIPYSYEKALELFRNPELKDFYKFVTTIAEDADQFKKDLTKESEKN